MTLFARRSLVLLALALPGWVWAQNFGFRPPRDPDDVAAVELMRDLAQRIVPVYQSADTDVFLSNVTALQIVSGAWRAADDSNKSLRTRQQGRPFDEQVQRAIIDGIYAHARAIEAGERIPFAKAYVRSFQEVVPPLDNPQAAAVIARLETPLAVFREPVRQAFDRWRAKGSLPQADAIALVRTWLEYESRRSFAVLLPELVAAENRRRYVAEADVWIPVRPGVVIHASVVRPGDGKVKLPTLLRFTLDPAEDDARRSAVKGYAGVTAYVRGRTPDGKGDAWPFVRDGEDATAVINWIALQPWSDGRVAMLGDGYSGYAAWAAARRKPPALKAIATIAPMAPGVDFPMAGQIYRNDMVRWAQEHAIGGGARADSDAGPDAGLDAKWQELDALWYRGNRPYWDVDRALLGKRSNLIRTWLTHPSHDLYWRKFLPSAQQFAQIDIPVLSIAGYFGGSAGALYFHNQHRRHRPQADTTLLLGPWDANSIRNGTAAQLRGYTLDPVARVDLPELRYQWLDHVFKDAPKPALLQDRVNYQVMGADQWRHVPTLDAPDRQRLRLRLYLDTREHEGEHRLLPSAPPSPSPSEAGGSARLAVDLADRRDVSVPWPDALRSKQLPTLNSIRFVSDPLPSDTEIDGSLRGEFDITPSRQDMDLNVSLYEQTASGEFQLLFEPYDFRASYARNRVYRRLLRAGERQMLAFTTERVTARKLAAGSRIVLVVGINKRPDRQINYGSGKDVNSETIADTPRRPVRVRWHAGSHVEIQTDRP
ncbi:CocE/NonD family hydrolase [Variovorax sp. J22R133]|uniref:CocE/NonD family hydrolase n=1 Tax=Variovorax brevis TaxID=3053503 RepID=UPI0025769511|nr:CocE/NonD family hydrolase [Variovorax sp. J22R133]MDM0111353.1 CocE/NonD family hydrolase [Variovorax sp. J22R133]